MAKIYIVIDQEFESCDIIAAFSTKVKAEDFVNHSAWEFEIAELEIDPSFDKSPKLWEVTLGWEDSRVWGCSVHEQHPPYVEYIHYEGGRCKILVRSETVSGAIQAASERLKRVRELEEAKFPLLRKRVVAHSPMDITGDYPAYNYRTGVIILYPLWTLVPGIEAPTEVREIAL